MAVHPLQKWLTDERVADSGLDHQDGAWCIASSWTHDELLPLLQLPDAVPARRDSILFALNIQLQCLLDPGENDNESDGSAEALDVLTQFTRDNWDDILRIDREMGLGGDFDTFVVPHILQIYTALHVHVPECAAVLPHVVDWLKSAHRGWKMQVATELASGPLYRTGFINGDSAPRELAVTAAPEGWVTIHSSSLHPMTDLANLVSARCRARVVVVLAQGVSEAYDVAVHENGRRLRRVGFAGGQWHRLEGTPFPFESDPLGTNIAEPADDPCYIFGREETCEYCGNLGLQLPWKSDGREREYTMLRVLWRKRPWWRFWEPHDRGQTDT